MLLYCNISSVWCSPESLISSSEATFMLMSWLSRLFFAIGLPSLGLTNSGCSAAAAATAAPAADPSWLKAVAKMGWIWLWERDAGLGLSASSALGSSFKWNGDLRASL